MFGNHCASCHTSCGDCHISQPGSVGGGFLDGHLFQRTPSMTRNCTACHGSRVGNEFLGKHEGLLADVHFREGRMNCVDCHTGGEMHGQPPSCGGCHPAPEDAGPMPPSDHRYSGLQSPRCESCHPTTVTGQDGIEMHAVHGAELSCQVCHSLSYGHCDGCHVAISERTGNPYFTTQATYLGFFLGRNPRPSYERPYAIVPLRHVPIAADNFDYYGEGLLPNFDSLPTWVYATPHNIQRITPQAGSCNACHGNPAIFLTADKVQPSEWGANQGVLVLEVPAPVPQEVEPGS
jgi:thiosulfate/3-mercaptopyruvate sulfurtransferase